MPRVKRGNVRRAKRKKLLSRAKGFYQTKSKLYRSAKESVDTGLETDIDTGLAVERNWFAGLFATEDRERGMRSFVEEGPGKAKFL